MELKDFRKIAAVWGYSVKTRRVSFEGLGYGVGRFIHVTFAGIPISPMMLKESAEEHKHIRRYLQEGITDNGQKLIWD